MINANNDGPPAEPRVSRQLSRMLDTAYMNGRIVKSLLGMIILCKLLEGPVYGYDLIKFVHRRFDTFLSPSIVYPALYDLEKGGIIRSGRNGKKKIYTLAEPSMARKLVENSVGAHMKVLRLAENGRFAGANNAVKPL